ncbi:MAG: preprotein translocase subunit SecG [Pseudomonadota bacterium]|nr:preprotein translocase subunit SecG [Pseudomonadota bacterium]
MISFITTVHVVACVLLIFFVLIQDAKGGSLGTFGGQASTSILGAAGAPTFFAKLTTGAAIIFAGTSIWLTMLTASPSKSATDKYVPAPATKQTEPIKVDGSAPPADSTKKEESIPPKK